MDKKKILVLSQVYWPDTASTAQHLSDLVTHLSLQGCAVEVWSSKYAYEDTSKQFPDEELAGSVFIRRIRHTSFGKKNVLGRLLDFFTFNFVIAWRLLWLPRNKFNTILGMTSPPLVSFLAAFFAKQKGCKFTYWTMDLQPELAIASGMIAKNSFTAKILTFLGDYALKKADLIFVLDKYMAQHTISRGGDGNKIRIVPVWPVMDGRYEGERLENPFRQENKFGDKIVIMYSGNHAQVHPLDTLLEAALALRHKTAFLFVFVGGGVRKKDVTTFKEKYALENIVQLPYQPRNLIKFSLGAADLQVVILGDGQVGYTHPNKIYGAMFIGKPILYIGPPISHVTDFLNVLPNNILVNHGETSLLCEKILTFASLTSSEQESIGKTNYDYAQKHFLPNTLINQMTNAIIHL